MGFCTAYGINEKNSINRAADTISFLRETFFFRRSLVTSLLFMKTALSELARLPRS